MINVRRKESYCYRIGLEIKCPEKCQIEMDNYGGDALDLSKMNDMELKFLNKYYMDTSRQISSTSKLDTSEPH